MGLSNNLSCEAGSLSCCRPNPTGIFTQRFEALFPGAGALGYVVCFTPRLSSRFVCVRMWVHGVLPAALPALFSATLSLALSVYLCDCRATGSASVQTACPVRPTLRQSQSHHGNVSPLRPVPVSAPPTSLDECLFFISLVSDFLAVRFSVSSGCARSCSVSTYAAILVLLYHFFWFFLRISVSLPTLHICSCMLSTLSIRALIILIRVV